MATPTPTAPAVRITIPKPPASVNTAPAQLAVPNSLPSPGTTPVPSDYASLGVTTGYTPKSPTQLRFFVLGPPGDGKTAFWAGCPRTLILDFEDGAWGVPSPRAHRIVCNTYETYERIHNKLVADAKAGRRPYDRVVYDTIDGFIEVVNPYLSAKKNCEDITDFGSKGAGWSLLRTACWNAVTELESVGFSWTCIGHITEKTLTVNGKDRTVTRPILFDSFARQVGRNADYVSTVHSAIESVPQYRTIQGRTIECGTTEKVCYRMDAAAVGSLFGASQNKQRGVPTLTSSIVLPDLMSGRYGWDAFCDAYNAAVQDVKSGTEPAPTPASAPAQ